MQTREGHLDRASRELLYDRRQRKRYEHFGTGGLANRAFQIVWEPCQDRGERERRRLDFRKWRGVFRHSSDYTRDWQWSRRRSGALAKPIEEFFKHALWRVFSTLTQQPRCHNVQRGNKSCSIIISLAHVVLIGLLGVRAR